MNLPLTGLAVFLVATFLRVRSPEGSIQEKLSRMDWVLVSSLRFLPVVLHLTTSYSQWKRAYGRGIDVNPRRPHLGRDPLSLELSPRPRPFGARHSPHGDFLCL